MAETQKLYTCECHTGGLVISQDNETPFDIWVSFWKYGQPKGKKHWRSRWNEIWSVLTKGHAYLDMVVLSPETAKEVGQRLIELAEAKPTEVQRINEHTRSL